jgi:hypothetical protein
VTESRNDFETAAQTATDRGLVREFWGFLRANKKWWLLPFILVILLLGALVTLYGSAAGPFIYTTW